MAAAAFSGTMTLVGSRGGNISTRITASDVAAANYVFPDGNGFIVLPTSEDWVLRDLMLSAAGTDTTRALIYVNGNSTGKQVQNAANVATVNSRQFLVNPLRFRPGAMLRFEQLA